MQLKLALSQSLEDGAKVDINHSCSSANTPCSEDHPAAAGWRGINGGSSWRGTQRPGAVHEHYYLPQYTGSVVLGETKVEQLFGQSCCTSCVFFRILFLVHS